MKFALLSVAAVGAALVGSGSASAHPPGYGYGPVYGGPVIVRPAPVVVVPIAPRPIYPVYPVYGSGFQFGVVQPGFSFSIGGGSVAPVYPYGGFYGPRPLPYYGGFGPRW